VLLFLAAYLDLVVSSSARLLHPCTIDTISVDPSSSIDPTGGEDIEAVQEPSTTLVRRERTGEKEVHDRSDQRKLLKAESELARKEVKQKISNGGKAMTIFVAEKHGLVEQQGINENESGTVEKPDGTNLAPVRSTGLSLPSNNSSANEEGIGGQQIHGGLGRRPDALKPPYSPPSCLLIYQWPFDNPGSWLLLEVTFPDDTLYSLVYSKLVSSTSPGNRHHIMFLPHRAAVP
jgi:hypothetical protein